ncbi:MULTISPECIES: AraC family transcriptional regulator [Staphylococcus]|jgi:AraC-like DNA-binding protein|uniref:Transcriptional regulator n=2 Tax=Staphylococcus nepalensis TaxID=214473 RepID=A0A380GN00_9STAP|nr:MULTISPECIES: AraC family transcriptional regulator [Staphylococcus]VDG67114.1 AraC-type sugar metabolism regulator [Lacrimispora indolis]MBO1204933.1 helix-turn-helix domain-containing protein [Staphylococcus nepalensis]PNZ97049.1 AraC family transcriptional regulator [Staphylococcus nepalensis]RIO44704.1 AraC family transcriptional regulator [Staphylococcus nepalensis]WQL19082.1 AraC family transcriptional regulator [Staphylococcus nepalensis]
MKNRGDFEHQFDTVSLPFDGEYAAWHKISDGHFGNELHYHDHYEIFFSLSGNMRYTIEGESFNLDVGSMLIIPPFEFHRLDEQMDGHAERIGLRFDANILNELSVENCDLSICFNKRSSKFKNLLQLSESQKRELYYLLQGLINEQDNDAFGKNLAGKSLLTQFLIILNRVAIENEHTSDNVDDPSTHLVRQVLDYMELHYNKEISLEHLENKFFVSRHKITQQFTKLVGYPPYRYLLNLRLQNAQRMLKDGGNPQQVAICCGFTDYSNFYRRFKHSYGCSPRDYLQQYSYSEKMKNQLNIYKTSK